jgi:hypothetical protein
MLQASYRHHTAFIPRNMRLPGGKWDVQMVPVWGTFAYTAADKHTLSCSIRRSHFLYDLLNPPNGES